MSKKTWGGFGHPLFFYVNKFPSNLVRRLIPVKEQVERKNMLERKNQAIRAILKGVYYNSKAHNCHPNWDDDDGKYWYYSKKEKCYKRAISIIDSQKNSGLKYLISKGPDQNGHPSNILYFEWKDDHTGEYYQVSFHKPRGSMKISGHTEIIWTGCVGHDMRLLKKLSQYYFDDEKFLQEVEKL